jgi:esterase/lipase superfamily enzyme
MRREVTSWYSERLGRHMPLVAYGHYGPPVLMLPTAAADFLEYERFQLIESVRWFLEQGKVKLYSVDSVNKLALLNDYASPQEKIAWMQRYDAYLTEEVLPLIRNDSGHEIKPMIMGISLGSSMAANTFFKHPDLFSGAILISGSYDLRGFFNGFYNEDLYFNNPVDFLGGMQEGPQLDLLRHGGKRILIFTGQGAHEAPDRARNLATILYAKGIPHQLDVWGHDVSHDWPWWRKVLPEYFGQLFG